MPRVDPSARSALLVTVLIAALIVLGEWLARPPAALGDDAAAEQFSAARAMRHVDRLAAAPRPAGSAAHAQAREYLIETLRGLGAEVERQSRLQVFDYDRHGGDARFAWVENVVARWPGRDDGPALLLMSHYDSVPAAPGAGDAASGVATILETVRALRVDGLPLRNPLIVLFADGEETGLFGAQAFFGQHRWAEQVGLVLNFDARGSGGPVAMFETSERNGALIAALASAAPAPLADSLVYSVYRQMPNDTDLSVARQAGKAGLNFAFVHGFFDYHRPTDTAANLSPDTLQHLGSYALPLARHFGEATLPPERQPDRHYFNPLGHRFVHYPPWFDWVGWTLAALLLAVAAGRAHRAGALPLRPLGRALLLAPFALLLPALLVFLLHRALDPDVTAVIARQRGWFVGWSLLAGGAAIALQALAVRGLGRVAAFATVTGLLLLALLAEPTIPLLAAVLLPAVAAVALLRRPLPREPWIAAQWLLWLLLTLLLLWWLPGATHALLWPLLALALLQLWRWRRPERRLGAAPAVLAAIPAAFWLGATALTFDVLIGFALPVAAVLPLLLVLVAFAPLLAAPAAAGSGLLLMAAAALGLGVLSIDPPWDARTPRGSELFVLHDGDRSYWASSDDPLDDWHRQRLGDAPERLMQAPYRPQGGPPLWRTAIDTVAVPAPRLELLGSDIDGEQRTLRLQLTVDGGSDQLALYLPAETDLQGWQVGGQPLRVVRRDPHSAWRLLGFALPAAGVELQLTLGPGSDWPELRVASVAHALPVGVALPERAADRMRRAYSYSDGSVSVARFLLQPDRIEPLPAVAAPEIR